MAKRRGRPRFHLPNVKNDDFENIPIGTKLNIRFPKDYVTSHGPAPIDTKSRLDECMTKLETAVFEAISKLKASI